MSDERFSKLQKQILVVLHENDYVVCGYGALYSLIVNSFYKQNQLTLNKRALSASLSRSIRSLSDKGYLYVRVNYYSGKCNLIQLNIVDDLILGASI